MRNPSRKTLSSYTFSLSSCRLDVVRCAGTCLRMRSLRQMHFIFPPAEPMVSARLHFSAVQNFFAEAIFVSKFSLADALHLCTCTHIDTQVIYTIVN
jgi:hypothetical protein